MKTKFSEIRNDLMNEKISIDEIKDIYSPLIVDFTSKVLTGKVDPDDPELDAFLRLCLDVYVYSINGIVLIPDSLYDQCMTIYRSNGKSQIIYADPIGKRWKFIKHEIPGMVGTLEKVYSYKELKGYLARFHGVEKYTISPKYDGISAAIKVENGEIVYAATRYDGLKGQDITALVVRARNGKKFIDPKHLTGFYKCELCVSTDAFEELRKEKPYSNRRSATSGIINTPTNIDLAKYITIIPLIFYDPKKKKLDYIAPYQKVVDYYSPSDLMDEVEALLKWVKRKDFPFRVDGIVINPDRKLLSDPNELDIMDTSIAFKINTAEGRTKIKYGYMSVGRTGKAVPCLKVEPVEVNETVVEDVSIGSYDKFLSMNLKENEEVIVYAAGDVIPQIKLPENRDNFENDPELKIIKRCPYCGEKLERTYTEYYCRNQNCMRVITGRIINFLDKIGIQGFSDKSIEQIYADLGIDNIIDFLNITKEQLLKVEGFSEISADNLLRELHNIRKTPLTISKFFGALGIENISERKCRKIFEYVLIKDILKGTPEVLDKIYWELQCASGVGEKTAGTFVDFVKDNLRTIRELFTMFNIMGDTRFKGNFCFTGFRPDQETRDRIRRMGYEVSEGSVTSETVALFTASLEKESTKSKTAISRGIPIYPAAHLDEILREFEKR